MFGSTKRNASQIQFILDFTFENFLPCWHCRYSGPDTVQSDKLFALWSWSNSNSNECGNVTAAAAALIIVDFFFFNECLALSGHDGLFSSCAKMLQVHVPTVVLMSGGLREQQKLGHCCCCDFWLTLEICHECALTQTVHTVASSISSSMAVCHLNTLLLVWVLVT